MAWIKQKSKSMKVVLPCITVRQKTIALNASLMRESDAKIGGFAEVYLSDCGSRVALKFFKEAGDGRYKITPDGGSLSRCDDLNFNAVIATTALLSNKNIASSVGTKKAKILVSKCESGMWVGSVHPTWQFKVSSRQPECGDIGVYRYLLENDVVYIGHGVIVDRMRESHRSLWVFDDVEYLILPKDEAIKEEARLIDAYVAEFGKLPFYNKVSGIKK